MQTLSLSLIVKSFTFIEIKISNDASTREIGIYPTILGGAQPFQGVSSWCNG